MPLNAPHQTNLFYANRTLNLGHRGASHYAPENTLPAFRLAAEMGADGVELDAQLTKDGRIVVIHEVELSHTTNGSGLVTDRTLAELRDLDAGASFSAEFAGTPIPTLEEVFASLGPVLLFNIELKVWTYNDHGLAAEVIRLIEDFNMQDRVILSSFNPFALKRAYQVNPKIKRGFLWRPKLPFFFIRRKWLRFLAHEDMYHPDWESVTPALIEKEHRRGHLLNTWTCDDPAEMRRLIKMGVDSIMTNQPDVLKQVLDETA